MKGVTYSLKEFLGGNLHLTDPRNNLYSIVIYLSPSNYHRIISPADVSFTDRTHIPGRLLPVKDSYAQKVKGLFTLNERVVLQGSWEHGAFALGMVGAYNVGSITVSHPSDHVTTNLPHDLLYSRSRHHKRYLEPWVTCPGRELGTFELGSTVVMVFEAPQLQWLVTSGQKVKVGQPIAVVGDRETKERVVDAYAESMKRAMEAVEKVTIEAPEEKWSKSEGESEGAETVSDDVDVIDMTEEEMEGEMTEQEADNAVVEIGEVADWMGKIAEVNETILDVVVPEDIKAEVMDDNWVIAADEKDKEFW